MERFPVADPAVAAVGYEAKRLEVEFHSGRVYLVPDVAARQVGAFLALEGRLAAYFNRYFRHRVQAVEVS